MVVLLISICEEKLHELEFVKPIEDILRRAGKDFFVRNYKDLSEKDLNRADKVIICGTSVLDNKFADGLEKFNWLKDFDKPVLGICGGMQIIGMVFGGKLRRKLEIGFFKESFKKEFLGLEGEQEVYHLHQNYVDFTDDFEVFSSGKIAQAVKHKEKEIYGVLFHPEVRQKEMILEFVK